MHIETVVLRECMPGMERIPMKIYKVANSVYDRLQDMDHIRYLCAMWFICHDLLSQYEDRASSSEKELMLGTLEFIRDLLGIYSGDASPSKVKSEIRGMCKSWRDLVHARNDDVTSAGYWNALATFEGLMDDVLNGGSREGAERIAHAALGRWREDDPGIFHEDPELEVEDSSPIARIIGQLDLVVSEISSLPESSMRQMGGDPVKLQEILAL